MSDFIEKKSLLIGLTDYPFNSTVSFWVEGECGGIVIDGAALFCEIANCNPSDFSTVEYKKAQKFIKTEINKDLIYSLRELANNLEGLLNE